jgi:hypothetical protein
LIGNAIASFLPLFLRVNVTAASLFEVDFDENALCDGKHT